MEPLTSAASGNEGASEAANIRLAVIPLDAGWSDIGSWRALLDLGERNGSGNFTQGDVFTQATHNCLVIAGSRLVATIGLEDTVVVETPDAVLVTNKDHTQDVRSVVEWLKERGREESKTHRRVYRPWGDYEQLDAGEGYQVKRLTVKPGAALSLQLHHKRAEHWVVVKGRAKVTRNEDTLYLNENESTYIPIGTKHRLENPGSVPLEVIEVQSGSYLGEDDIVRFEDRYNRS
jgi:mannose-1-phosphate guanylyltransferase/mannose-6-phosphate isomerase